MARQTFTAFDVDLFNRSEQSIAHGALTNSKRAQCFVKGVYPTHLREGKGCYVWDTLGNRYIDFICGLGSSILGYANEEVNGAMMAQLRRGSTFSLGTELEVLVAEKVKELFPFVEKVRILKTGTDACNAALRIARTKTGRKLVASHAYHGWGDEFTSLTPPARGVNEHPFIRKGEECGDHTAALITEPVITDASPERVAALKALREECTKTGTMLIFDEIITGMRFPKFGVSNYFGVEPDILCLGKAVANGMPVSIIAGKADVMECDDYFVSSTFAGETISLAAALKTMSLLQTKFKLDHLWNEGKKFQARFNSIAPELVSIEGYPTRGVFKGEMYNKALFWQEACKAGLLFGPSFFFNFSHIDVADQVISSCEGILRRIKTGSVVLEGELPQVPYAQKTREQK